jgi:hypothetical protein
VINETAARLSAREPVRPDFHEEVVRMIVDADPADQEPAADSDEGLPRAKVEAARKVIQKPRELFDAAEGHLLAVKALRFGTHVFEEDEGPAEIAEVAVVDLGGTEPEPLAVVEISWRRIIRQLAVASRDSWLIGRLVKESEHQAVELEPPDESVDLDVIAERLNRLRMSAPKQLALGSSDDDIPF